MVTVANYFGELIVIIGSVLAVTYGIALIVKLIFKEMNEYKKSQLKPFEKSLNTMLDTASHGIETMIKTIENLNKKENKDPYEYYNQKVDDLDVMKN